ncbi:hypothetical protein LINPERPRIM_LOCUS44487 [Linum perenne]
MDGRVGKLAYSSVLGGGSKGLFGGLEVDRLGIGNATHGFYSWKTSSLAFIPRRMNKAADWVARSACLDNLTYKWAFNSDIYNLL